ncbi:hypothetical protein KBD09_03305 [Candidatus Woesebacteria bacterium]|nr:hypothetical protein [Candidatus Woesebacteria bacterium]
MGIIAISCIILVISFILALRSMKDLKFGEELEKIFQRKKIKGTIVFFEDKVTHYDHQSSKSSSPSSSASSEK